MATVPDMFDSLTYCIIDEKKMMQSWRHQMLMRMKRTVSAEAFKLFCERLATEEDKEFLGVDCHGNPI